MMRLHPLPPETLVINLSSSRCENCGEGCIPTEKRHESTIGYGVPPGTKGCGIEWKFVTSEYMDALTASANMRPDLELIQWGTMKFFPSNPV